MVSHSFRLGDSGMWELSRGHGLHQSSKKGLGFRVWGLGFGVWGLGFRV